MSETMKSGVECVKQWHPNFSDPKMLHGENIQSFCTMTRDAVSYLAKTRGDAGFDNEIPNLEDVLYNFSAESKYIYQW